MGRLHVAQGRVMLRASYNQLEAAIFWHVAVDGLFDSA